MSKFVKSVLVIAMLSVLVLAGCGGGGSSSKSGGSDDVIKIGVPTPLSSPGDFKAGEINVNTLKLAQKEVNADGGVIGKKVELVVSNDEGNLSKGVSLVKTMTQKDKVSAILGVWHGSVAQAQANIATEEKTPMILHYSWPDEITKQHSDYVFRISPFNSQIVDLLVPYFKEEGFEHVAIMSEDTEYGIGFSEALVKAGEENGFKVTNVTYSSEAVDFSSELLKLKKMSNPPELTMVASVYKPMYLIPKQASEVGLTEVSKIMAGWDYPVSSDEFWDTNGEAGIGLLYPSFYSKELTLSESGKNFANKYKEEYGENPPIYAYYLYDAFQMIMKAVEEADSSEPEKIAEKLKDLEYEGTTGTVKFDREDVEGSPVWNQWMGHQIFVNQLNNVGDMSDEAELIWTNN